MRQILALSRGEGYKTTRRTSMNKYEILYILNASLSDEEINAQTEK